MICNLPEKQHVRENTDREGVLEMLRMYTPNLVKVEKVICNGGYSGENFADAVRLLLDAEVEVAKRNELALPLSLYCYLGQTHQAKDSKRRI